jgi:hypothetical protein
MNGFKKGVAMRYMTLFTLAAIVGGSAFAEDEKAKDSVAEIEAAQGKVLDSDDLKETGAERNARRMRNWPWPQLITTKKLKLSWTRWFARKYS